MVRAQEHFKILIFELWNVSDNAYISIVWFGIAEMAPASSLTFDSHE